MTRPAPAEYTTGPFAEKCGLVRMGRRLCFCKGEFGQERTEGDSAWPLVYPPKQAICVPTCLYTCRKRGVQAVAAPAGEPLVFLG